MKEKEKIIAYIDKLLEKYPKNYYLLTVAEFVDSLQEEPVSGNIDFEKELYKAFGQVKDFTLGMQIAKRFYDMGKNSKDSQDPVSEELLDAANDYGVNIRKGYPRVMDETDKYIYNAFKAGAQWQKEKEYTCYEEAFEDGASWKKKEMMKDAVDATLLNGNLIKQKHTTHPLHVGDKVKIIIIKEDEL